MDLVVEGKAYVNGSIQQCCIRIKEGKIQEIKKILTGDTRINSGKLLILPAGIDVHVHFRDPGYIHKEDFFTGSLSAAFGGTTCILDMPNTNPPAVTEHVLKEKHENVRKKSVVDYGVAAGITIDNLAQLPDLSPWCQGFKIFLGSSTNAMTLPPSHLPKAFQITEQIHKPVFIHAEDERCLQQHYMITTSLRDHERSRPPQCEETSIQHVMQSSKQVSHSIHIYHVSSGEGIQALRQRPSTLSVGVTPHHLLLDISQRVQHQTYFKVNPPLRQHFDREILFEALQQGVISLIESDHAPHTQKEKEQEFNEAPSGIPGVETRYPLLLALAQQNHLSLPQVITWCCEKPAQLLNVPKGRIAEGMDADLILVDWKKHARVHADALHTKCEWTPFEGWKAVFPSQVLLRGKTLITDGEFLERPGCGQCYGE